MGIIDTVWGEEEEKDKKKKSLLDSVWDNDAPTKVSPAAQSRTEMDKYSGEIQRPGNIFQSAMMDVLPTERVEPARREPGMYSDTGPGMVTRAARGVGIEQPKTSPIDIESVETGQRPYKIKQDVFGTGKTEEARRVVGQFMGGATGGITDVVQGEEQLPETAAGKVAGGVAKLAGFLAGPVKATSKLYGTKLGPNPGKTLTENIEKYLTQDAITLGSATAIAGATGTFDQPDFKSGLEKATSDFTDGALTGAAFTAIKFLRTPLKLLKLVGADRESTSGKVLDAITRLGIGLVGMDAMKSAQSGQPLGIVAAAMGKEDPRDLTEKAYDKALDAFFILKGGGAQDHIKKIAAISKDTPEGVIYNAVNKYNSNKNRYKDGDKVLSELMDDAMNGKYGQAYESAKTFENAQYRGKGESVTQEKPGEKITKESSMFNPERVLDASDKFKEAFKHMSKQESPATDEILGVWRSMEQTNPGLHEFVKSLDDKQKINLAKSAMRGEMPPWFEGKMTEWNWKNPESKFKLGETAPDKVMEPEMKRSEMDEYIQEQRRKFYSKQEPAAKRESSGIMLEAGGLQSAYEALEKRFRGPEKLFPRGVSRYKDVDVVSKIKEQTSKELKEWDEKYSKDYKGFYDKDIPETNAKLQEYAKKEYGRELKPEEVDLFHMASAFGSPASRPSADTSLGMQIMHRYLKTGKLSGAAFGEGVKYGTGERFGTEPVRQVNQISVAYQNKGLNKVGELIKQKGLKGAMDWMRSWHSPKEIAQVMGTTVNKLPQHEYLSREDGGLGVMAVSGPKLGSYILNRLGNLSTVTKDMWYARTMGRYTGQKLSFYDNKEGRQKAIKKPWATTMKGTRMRKLADQAWGELAKEQGIDPAIIQQRMWDYEKQTWDTHSKTEESKSQGNLFGEPPTKRDQYYPSEGIELGKKKIEEHNKTHPELQFGPFKSIFDSIVEKAGQDVGKSKEVNKESILRSLKSGDIDKESPIRMTSMSELQSIMKTKKLSEGQDFEGRQGISAQVPGKNKEPIIVAYGSNKESSVGIIFPKDTVIGKGEAPGEVKINPDTKVQDLKFVVNGKIRSFDELSKTHTEYVHDLTIKDGGATYNLGTGKQEEGFSVSVHRDRENAKYTKEEFKKDPNILADYIANNMDLLEKPEKSLGTWVRGDNKVVMDVVEVTKTLQEAKKLGRENKQDAIYDLKNGNEIPIRPTEKYKYDHYSTTKGLKSISPDKAYSGAGGSEKAYGEYPEFDTKGAYTYHEGGKPEHTVTTRAKAKYSGEIEGDFLKVDSKEYKEIRAEAEKLIQDKADEYGAANNIAKAAATQHLAKVKYGYDGIVSKEGIKSFKDIPVSKEGGIEPGAEMKPIDPNAPNGPVLNFGVGDVWDKFIDNLIGKAYAKDVKLGRQIRRDYNGLMEFFNPGMTLNDKDKWFESRQEARGKIDKIAGAGGLIERLQAKYGDLDASKKEDIWHVLNGDKPLSSLSADLQPAAKRLRVIDNILGRMLVKSQIISPETYFKHEGSHIKRIYSLFARDYQSGISGSGIKMEPFSKRTVVSEREMERLGIIKDPIAAITQSILEVTKASAMTKHFKDIAGNENFVYKPSLITVDAPLTLGPGRSEKMTMGIGQAEKMLQKYLAIRNPNVEQQNFISELETKIEQSQQNVGKISKEYTQLNGDRYGMLDGAYVHKTIANDLRPVFEMSINEHSTLKDIANTLMVGQQLWKMKNVALNVPTMGRNVLSNMIQLNMSGMNLGEVGINLAKAVAQMAEKSPEWKAAQKQGLFTSNFTAGELSEITGIISKMNSPKLSAIMEGATKLGKFYGKIDDVFKLAKFNHSIKEGQSVAKAAQEANKWGMDYSLVSPAVKKFRNIALGAPFISYQYKIAPLIVESLAKRPWVIAKYLAIPAILQGMVTKDMTDEDAKKYLADLPEYVKNGQVFMIPGKHGMNAYDMSYSVPWGNWWKMAVDVGKGQVWKAGKDLGIASGILPTIMAALTTGKDLFTGEDINSEMSKYDNKLKLQETLQYIAKQILPPMLSPDKTSVVGKTYQHLKTGETKTGLKTEGMNIYPRAVGINIYPINPKASELEKARDIKAVRKELIKKITDKTTDEVDKRNYKLIYKYAIEKIKEDE